MMINLSNTLKKKNNKKGFTLIELIVVIAILAILAAIAIPRFSGLQASSKLKSDGSTAAQIVSAARIQEVESGGVKVTSLTQTGTAAAGDLQKSYMTVPAAAQSGGTFAISGGGPDPYVIKWTSTTAPYDTEQVYTENVVYEPKLKP